MEKPYIKEIIFTIVTAIWFLFVSVNVNQTLGNTYIGFTIISSALLIIGLTIFDKNLRITFQKREGGTIQAIAYGFVGWVILMIISSLVLRFLQPGNSSFSSVMSILGASTPALANSKILNFITFAIPIAYIETQLWARGAEFIADLRRETINKKNLYKGFSILLILGLSFLFLIFHLTAKGVTAYPALAIVFVMMMISLIMVYIFEETRQAVYFHIIANSIASYIIFFGI